jgi:hypothetical protein
VKEQLMDLPPVASVEDTEGNAGAYVGKSQIKNE